MKKISAVLLVILFISCKKDGVDEPPPVPPAHPDNKVEADVLFRGGTLHILSSGDNITLEKQDYNFTKRNLDSVLIIYGVALFPDGSYDKSITLFLANIKDTGTYVFGHLDSGRSIQIMYAGPGPNPNSGGTYLADSDKNTGELIVESISDKVIKGRFSGNGYPVYWTDTTDVAKFTNGRFSCDLP